jgi:transmembrane sensor
VRRGPQIGANPRAESAALWATRLADGQMPEGDRAELQAWLDAEPANAAALEETIGAWQAVEHYAANPEIMALREAALASARRSLRGREGARWTRRRLAWGALAASLLVVVAVSGAWAWFAPRTYETGVGERRVVALSDGSKVSLDADTLVKVRYTSDKRQLWLARGRAHFDVARNPLRAFSVAAADQVVVATGTAFSVELVQKQVRVVLYEGHVMVLDRKGEGVRRTVEVAGRRVAADQLLAPGRELVLPIVVAADEPVSTAPAVMPADPVRSLSWEGGLLVFEDVPLSLVVERMNRYAETPLEVGDQPTGELRISGVFRAGDTDALVQGLDAAFGVKARGGAQEIALYRGR